MQIVCFVGHYNFGFIALELLNIALSPAPGLSLTAVPISETSGGEHSSEPDIQMCKVCFVGHYNFGFIALESPNIALSPAPGRMLTAVPISETSSGEHSSEPDVQMCNGLFRCSL